MSTPAILYGPNGKPLHTEPYTLYDGGTEVLCTTTPQREHSVFINKSWITAVSNVRVVTPVVNGTIEILDFVVSGSKKAAGTITIRWNDGTDTDNMFVGSVDDAPINIAATFAGRVEGWKNAYLEYTIVSVWVGSLLITYVHHVLPGPTYSSWNSRR